MAPRTENRRPQVLVAPGAWPVLVHLPGMYRRCTQPNAQARLKVVDALLIPSARGPTVRADSGA